MAAGPPLLSPYLEELSNNCSKSTHSLSFPMKIGEAYVPMPSFPPPSTASSFSFKEPIKQLQPLTNSPRLELNQALHSSKLSYSAIVKGGQISNLPEVARPLIDRHLQVLDPESVESIALKPKTWYQGKPAVIFPLSEKKLLVEKLKFVLVGKFSHGRPALAKIREFVAAVNLKRSCNITLFDKKHIFIECSCKIDYDIIWMKLVWIIDGFAMRILKWTADFNPLKESAIVPVWIRLEGLPLYLFDEKSLLIIANSIGKPIRVDPRNVAHNIVHSARVCVELDISQPLLEEVWVSFEDDLTKKVIEGFWAKVCYDVIPPYCSFCYHIGHGADRCKRRVEEQVLLPQNSQQEGVLEAENSLGLVSKQQVQMGIENDAGCILVDRFSHDSNQQVQTSTAGKQNPCTAGSQQSEVQDMGVQPAHFVAESEDGDLVGNHFGNNEDADFCRQFGKNVTPDLNQKEHSIGIAMDQAYTSKVIRGIATELSVPTDLRLDTDVHAREKASDSAPTGSKSEVGAGTVLTLVEDSIQAAREIVGQMQGLGEHSSLDAHMEGQKPDTFHSLHFTETPMGQIVLQDKLNLPSSDGVLRRGMLVTGAGNAATLTVDELGVVECMEKTEENINVGEDSRLDTDMEGQQQATYHSLHSSTLTAEQNKASDGLTLSTNNHRNKKQQEQVGRASDGLRGSQVSRPGYFEHLPAFVEDCKRGMIKKDKKHGLKIKDKKWEHWKDLTEEEKAQLFAREQKAMREMNVAQVEANTQEQKHLIIHEQSTPITRKYFKDYFKASSAHINSALERKVNSRFY